MKKNTFLFLFFFSFLFNYSQENQSLADSIIQVAKNNKKDSLTIQILHRDFFKYCYSKPEVAKRLADETIKLSAGENDYLLIRSFLRKGIYYDVTGKKDSALMDYDRAYLIATKIDDKDAIASVYNNKGLINWDRENYEEAMAYYLKSYKIFQEVNKPKGQASSLNNIGMLLFKLDRLQESTSYHKRSLKIRMEIKDSIGIGASYSNLSKNYTFLKKMDSAIYYSHKALKIKKRVNDIRGLGIVYNNLGGDYQKLKQMDSAIYYLKKADDIYKQLNSKRLRATNIQALGAVYFDLEKYNDAIKSYQIALDNIDVTEIRSKYKANYNIAQSYNELKNYTAASIYFKTALDLKDSIVSENEKVKTQEIFEKYQSTEKEKEILKQRANLAEQSLTIQQRNYQIFGLIAFAAILGFLGYLFYNQQKLKNQQLKKENALNDALAKIETQNRLQEQRLRISRDLHDNIGAQLTFIISSIDNMKYGFTLPKKLDNKLSSISSFTTATIYELRDTIWAMNKNEITFEDLQSRISNFVDKANFVSKDITFSFSAEENTQKDLKLSSVDGMNIYRIIQEAVNNALKYAQASKIEVYLNNANKQLCISVLDNGKGFNKEEITLGNGINNMKKRAQLINGKLDIETAINKGTIVKFKKVINT